MPWEDAESMRDETLGAATIACIKSDFNPSFSILWMNWGCGNIHHILWTIPTSWAGLQLSHVFFVGRHFVSLNQCQETAQSWVFSLAPQGGTAWKVKVLSAKWSLGTCLWSMVCWLEVNSNWTWGGTCFEGLISRALLLSLRIHIGMEIVGILNDEVVSRYCF